MTSFCHRQPLKTPNLPNKDIVINPVVGQISSSLLHCNIHQLRVREATMFHWWKHIVRSFISKRKHHRFFSGLHSDKYVGAPNADEARRDFLRAVEQQTYLRMH